MIIVVSTPECSRSTDPTAAALSAAFRPASFAPAHRTDEALANSAKIDIERLYPNLSEDQHSARSWSPIRHALAILRHAVPSL